ncbi:Por secretion system C-terminal sorting domain-containing protein [Flavobacterium fluvii]|uniref:Por secretion system C-terminal sorting domain-containing protein n=1 Tax=Flavobacterium fluvii TaxID=468056 RepID=A0A1M5FN83_9FLAO|nr:T9SS type A sorting domain-containing protein [Flavobacterium fluvii]SHF92946.1 Por secretion system C-terminal sorting domain-containing protein [Flavobacterium fluvii]
MKKLYTFFFILSASLSFGQTSLPFSDTFSYASGNLHETSPWSAVGTASPSDHILLDGSKVTFAGGGTDAQVLINTQTTGTIYFKLDLKITSMAGVTDANGGYLAGFAQNSTTFGGTLWAKRIDDNTYNLGIETRTGTGLLTTYTTSTYNTGTSYSIIISYTFNTASAADDVTKLWVNPTSSDEATPLLTDTHTGTDLTQIASFFLRQDSTTETGSAEVDNLRISTTFADVLANNKFNTIAGLSVYPNPVTKGTLYITSNSDSAKSVAIFDVLGKQVLNTKTSSNTVNVSTLKGGVYIIKITEEGKTDTKKLIIE